MDLVTNAPEKDSLGKEIVKSLAISTATSAGFWGGLIIAGTLANVLKGRKAQKTTETQ